MIIPQSVFDLYNTTITDFIDSNFGVTCRLYYGINKTICPNCIYNPGLDCSTNQYKIGGPIEFTNGICPYCDGIGYRNDMATEEIKMRVYFERKSWVKLEVPINLIDGSIQTIGHIEDIQKIKKCNYALINTSLENINQYNFVLASDPVPFGLTKKEFIAYWNRKQ